MSLLPHTTQPITTEPASYEMRGWMEGVSSSINNIALTYTAVSGNVTTTGSQFLRVNGPYIVTLNALPADGEQVDIQLGGNYTVQIVGMINGVAISYMHVAYDYLSLRYVADLGEWVG